MWHEARRQERKIRVMMVDYKKRADRRREYYEKIVSWHWYLNYRKTFFKFNLFAENDLCLCNMILCFDLNLLHVDSKS